MKELIHKQGPTRKILVYYQLFQYPNLIYVRDYPLDHERITNHPAHNTWEGLAGSLNPLFAVIIS